MEKKIVQRPNIASVAGTWRRSVAQNTTQNQGEHLFDLPTVCLSVYLLAHYTGMSFLNYNKYLEWNKLASHFHQNCQQYYIFLTFVYKNKF